MGRKGLLHCSSLLRTMVLVYFLRSRGLSLGTTRDFDPNEENPEEVHLGIRTSWRDDRCNLITRGRRFFRKSVSRRHEENRADSLDPRINTSSDTGMSDPIAQPNCGKGSTSGSADGIEENECRVSYFSYCCHFLCSHDFCFHWRKIRRSFSWETSRSSCDYSSTLATEVETCRLRVSDWRLLILINESLSLLLLPESINESSWILLREWILNYYISFSWPNVDHSCCRLHWNCTSWLLLSLFFSDALLHWWFMCLELCCTLSLPHSSLNHPSSPLSSHSTLPWNLRLEKKETNEWRQKHQTIKLSDKTLLWIFLLPLTQWTFSSNQRNLSQRPHEETWPKYIYNETTQRKETWQWNDNTQYNSPLRLFQYHRIPLSSPTEKTLSTSSHLDD
jgi:hypothetical protein